MNLKTLNSCKRGQISFEFMLVIFVCLLIIGTFIPITKKTFSAAQAFLEASKNKKKMEYLKDNINMLCLLEEGSRIELEKFEFSCKDGEIYYGAVPNKKKIETICGCYDGNFDGNLFLTKKLGRVEVIEK